LMRLGVTPRGNACSNRCLPPCYAGVVVVLARRSVLRRGPLGLFRRTASARCASQPARPPKMPRAKRHKRTKERAEFCRGVYYTHWRDAREIRRLSQRFRVHARLPQRPMSRGARVEKNGQGNERPACKVVEAVGYEAGVAERAACRLRCTRPNATRQPRNPASTYNSASQSRVSAA